MAKESPPAPSQESHKNILQGEPFFVAKEPPPKKAVRGYEDKSAEGGFCAKSPLPHPPENRLGEKKYYVKISNAPQTGEGTEN